MKRYSTFALLLLLPLWMAAQRVTQLDLIARASYRGAYVGGEHSPALSGFKGEYVTTRLGIDLTHGFSFTWRQRFSKSFEGDLLNATDRLYFTYERGRWTLQGGKMALFVGGFEFDAVPWDVHYYSHGVLGNCDQFGGAVTYSLADRHTLSLAVQQSTFHPFSKDLCGRSDVYQYTAYYSGSCGRLQLIHSLGAIEYRPAHYMMALDLGHRLDLHPVTLMLDLHDYFVPGNSFLSDCRLLAQADWRLSRYVNVQGKYVFTQNRDKEEANYYVAPGTRLHQTSGGIECFPIRGERTLRLHALASYMWGECADLYRTFQFTLGATMQLDCLRLFRKQ